uniref:Uncharacterized protein n=1 Tax=Molossus molossus TaxID=27622 RepID=A0A7J8GQS4_MOLMO|nr:hypothetical protein HJG59_011323 [Molossus molossus]
MSRSLSQPHGSNKGYLHAWIEICEKMRKEENPLLSNLISLENRLAAMRGNRKKNKDNQIICTQFLISFKPEDTKQATESYLGRSSPNNVFLHPHIYVHYTQYSFRFEAADVFITISTSKPIP